MSYAELADVVQPSRKDVLEPCQEARMESATGELCHIVTGDHVIERKLHWSELLQSYIAEPKLTKLSLSTRIYIAISSQEAGVLKATVNLDHLLVAF